jgi:hypothetical protein
MNMTDVKKLWESFQPATPDPYKRVEGVRLMITQDGRAGIREDGVGKVHFVTRKDCVFGRDDGRVEMLQRRAAKQMLPDLEQVMEVPRCVVVGRKKTLQTEAIRKHDCLLTMDNGAIQKPKHIFVTYRTKTDKRRRRKVLGDVTRQPRTKRVVGSERITPAGKSNSWAEKIQAARAECKGALCLFRIGDFYELYFEDATIAAKVLGLTITSRDKGDSSMPMTGFPYHQLESYLAKLIAAGHRAAVCEEVK